MLDLALVNAEAGGRVCLGVKVANQHPQPQVAKRGSQVDSGGGFPHAALLIHDCNNGTHFFSPFLMFHVKHFICLFRTAARQQYAG